jgi:uncharacterized protein YpmS
MASKPWRDWRWFAALAALLIAVAFVAMAWSTIANTSKLRANSNKLATNSVKLRTTVDDLNRLIAAEAGEHACFDW